LAFRKRRQGHTTWPPGLLGAPAAPPTPSDPLCGASPECSRQELDRKALGNPVPTTQVSREIPLGMTNRRGHRRIGFAGRTERKAGNWIPTRIPSPEPREFRLPSSPPRGRRPLGRPAPLRLVRLPPHLRKCRPQKAGARSDAAGTPKIR